ncbi:hypothetical protein ABPG73_000866 [Tetrahymena malaccensis]
MNIVHHVKFKNLDFEKFSNSAKINQQKKFESWYKYQFISVLKITFQPCQSSKQIPFSIQLKENYKMKHFNSTCKYTTQNHKKNIIHQQKKLYRLFSSRIRMQSPQLPLVVELCLLQNGLSLNFNKQSNVL